MKKANLFKIVIIMILFLSIQVNYSHATVLDVECTNLTEPQNGETNVSVSTDLSWNAVSGADGYLLKVGTTSNGGDILDNEDVGNVTTYDLVDDLPYGSTIYVTITPYDGSTPLPCDEESFETEDLIVLYCTHLTDPVNGATNVSITTDLTWEAVAGVDGYLLQVGTTSDGTEIIDNENVGNVTTWDLADDLPCGSTIYVSIHPYIGETLLLCNGEDEESFETEYVSANAGWDQTICYGTSTQLEASGGTSYQWSPASSLNDPNIYNPIASPISTTTYTVTVTNANGCFDIDEIEVQVNSETFANASATDETCNGCNDGTATANPSGGTPPYYYNWSNGAETQTITNLSPGNYTVTVGDANECEATQTVTVVQYVCPDLTIVDNQSNTCFGQCNGYINITDVTNGTAPFTYLWNDGQTTSGIDGLCVGNYSVTVTDAKNCTVSKSYTISEFPQIIPNASKTDETCNGCNDGTATANPSGGTPPYYYNWSNGAETQTITNLSPGNYTVTVGDANECEATQTVIVSQFGCPDLIIVDNLTNVSCNGSCDGSISITSVTNSEGTLSYLWSNGSTDSSISNLCPNDYSVTVTDNSSNCGTSKSYKITQPAILDLNISKIDETCNSCNNGTATANPLGGTTPYLYHWNNNATTKTISNLSPDKYYVTVTDANGCQKIDSTIINQYDCPNMTIQDKVTNVSCFDECNASIEIISVSNSIGTLTYQWNNESSNSSIYNLCIGNYSVTVTDISNSCNVIKNYIITQPNDIIITIDNKTNPTESTKGKIDISTNNDGNYSFTWSGPDGFSANTEDINDLSAGCYKLIVTNSSGCKKDTTICLEKETATFDIINIQEDIIVFPNPASNNFIIDLSKVKINKKFSISLYNTTGKMFITNVNKQNENIFDFDISDLDSGLYFIKIKFKRGVVFKKLIIEK